MAERTCKRSDIKYVNTWSACSTWDAVVDW